MFGFVDAVAFCVVVAAACFNQHAAVCLLLFVTGGAAAAAVAQGWLRLGADGSALQDQVQRELAT
jgi:hypothetical protein